MKGQQQFAILTPKAVRMEHLMAEGMSFDVAFAIVDLEYTRDGLSLKGDAVTRSTDLPVMDVPA